MLNFIDGSVDDRFSYLSISCWRRTEKGARSHGVCVKLYFLENTTIYDNSDTSNIKFNLRVPSGIVMSESSN